MTNFDVLVALKGETIATVATKAKISPAALYRLWHGVGQRSSRRIRAVAEVLGLSVADRLFDDVDREKIINAL